MVTGAGIVILIAALAVPDGGASFALFLVGGSMVAS